MFVSTSLGLTASTKRLAWGGALILVLGILGATLLSRLVLWWHRRSLNS